MPSPNPFAPVFLDLGDNNVHADPDNLDAAVRGHGVAVVHHRGMPCPVGRVDPHDQRRPHPDHEGCTNGTLFTRAGACRALFVGNSKEKKRADFGYLDASVAQLTFPRTYDGGGEALLQVGDLITLADQNVTVPFQETVRASGAPVDRLARQVVSVQDLVDARGLRYVAGKDFAVRDGKVAWLGRRPTADVATGLPALYAVRYLFNPSWYVTHLVHETRVGQAPDGGTIRLPQSVMVAREHVFLAAQNDPEARAGKDRQQPGPPDGSAGPT